MASEGEQPPAPSCAIPISFLSLISSLARLLRPPCRVLNTLSEVLGFPGRRWRSQSRMFHGSADAVTSLDPRALVERNAKLRWAEDRPETGFCA